MDHFKVFELTDISERSPIGEVVVKPDGALEFEPELGSAHIERLRQALAEVGSTKLLPLTSREIVGTGAEAKSVLKVRDIAAGDPLYGWAVADALRGRHGFHFAPVPESAEEPRGEPRS